MSNADTVSAKKKITNNMKNTSKSSTLQKVKRTLQGGVKFRPLFRAALVLLAFLLSFSAQTAWAQDLIISSTLEWNYFAAAVNNGTTYSGQTVALAADIQVTTMVGTSIAGTSEKKWFEGTFYGNGHTLTFNATADEEYCAPFRYIKGATIKCLKVEGEIKTDKKYASGIAGMCSGTCTIQNCQSSITIKSSVGGDGDGTHGGFVSMQQDDANLTISNCLFDGSITGDQTINCSGFVGWRCTGGILTFNNCLMAGSMPNNKDNGSALFNRNGGSTLNHCYYDESKGYGEITKQGDVAPVTGRDLQTLLGYGWVSDGTSVKPFMKGPTIISLDGDWNAFAAAVNSGTSYSGQTVVLAADINVSTMAGTKDNRFEGTFLGNGHTLTFEPKAAEEYCAPFRYIKGATINCLKVTGTITTDKKYASGIAGECSRTCTIQSCQSSITINSSVEGDGTHGGFVGAQQDDAILTISNCLFDGSITGDKTTNCGGFVGWRGDVGTLIFNNCLMAGSMSIIKNDGSALFNRNGGSTLNNCYYFDDGNNNYGAITEQGNATTATGSDLQTLLGYGWAFDGTSVEPIMDDINLVTATISGISSSLFYTGKPYTVTYTVTAADGSALSEDTHYTATITKKDGSGSTVQKLGDYTLTITAIEGSGYTGTQTFDFSVVPLGMSVDNEIEEGKVGHYYVNMPKEGSTTISIPEGFTSSFKVYDDRGKKGYYSDYCDGSLVLTAPEGYLLQLSGNITTEERCDYLTAYDGDDQNGTKLLDNVSGSTAITTVISSGQKMTLYFNSDKAAHYNGLDLTVTLVDQNTDFNITVNPAVGGSVNSDLTTAKGHETVTLTASPAEGYILSDISVVDASDNTISVEWNVWTNTATFKMPGSAVTVNQTFTALTNLSVNMPKTDTKYVTIPQGVKSFKVYDDGGSAGYYSNYCDGYLVLTAPTGYVLQLSGNITTETCDRLTAYDGDEKNGTKLLGPVGSTLNGVNTDITTVISSGQKMTLYFYSSHVANYPGLDLTVTLLPVIDGDSDANVTFTEQIENATVTFNREFTKGVNSTLILPFGFTLTNEFKTEYGNFYSLTEIRYNDDDNQWEGWLDNPVDGEVAANTPYVFVPSKTFNSITFTDVTIETTSPKDVTVNGENSNDWTFKGTYSRIENFETHDKPIYGFAGTNNSSIAVGEFVRANKSKVSIKPLRCYLEYNGNNPNLSKSALELPDRIVLHIISSVIDPDDPTENPGSDITTPTSELAPAANVKVWSYDKTICIAAAPNTPYRIIDATGRVLKDDITATDRDEIRLGNHSGIVIVIISGKTFKVSY